MFLLDPYTTHPAVVGLVLICLAVIVAACFAWVADRFGGDS